MSEADRIVALELALQEAIDEYAYAVSYKGEYLAKKHGDTERIAQMREVLAGTRELVEA